MELQALRTGIDNLDELLGGGIPIYTTQMLAGRPGIGKTVLAQNISFNMVRGAAGDGRADGFEGSEVGGSEVGESNIGESNIEESKVGGSSTGGGTNSKVLYLTTVSEPLPKIVRFMRRFDFFDAEAYGRDILFEDLGESLRKVTLTEGVDLILDRVTRHRPDLLVIDSFRAIGDLRHGGGSTDNFRLFSFDLAARLAGARCTTLLVGEYTRDELQTAAEFAVADGTVFLDITSKYGKPQRTIEVTKMRGRPADRRRVPYLISDAGVRVVGSQSDLTPPRDVSTGQIVSGVEGLDAMLHGGLPAGRAVLLAGQSGSGKTTMATQFLDAGCRHGERGVLFSFEESAERLRELATSFGWDLDAHERAGLLRIVHVRQPDIRVMSDLDRIEELLREFRPHRVVVDSMSVFLHQTEVGSPRREVAFRLVDLVRQIGATGLFLTVADTAEEGRLPRLGVEDTVVDGIFALSLSTGDFGLRRYIQIHKMRATPHVTGRRRVAILDDGLEVFYETPSVADAVDAPVQLVFEPFTTPPSKPRGDDASAEYVTPYATTWLVRDAGGDSKAAVAAQFAAEGLRHGESVLYVPIAETDDVFVASLSALDVDVAASMDSGALTCSPLAPSGDEIAADPEELIHALRVAVRRASRPLRLVVDSLWPFAARLSPEQFLTFVRRKNAVLRGRDLAILDTLIAPAVDERTSTFLRQIYDGVIDIDPGQGNGQRGAGIVTTLTRYRGGVDRQRAFRLPAAGRSGDRPRPGGTTTA